MWSTMFSGSTVCTTIRLNYFMIGSSGHNPELTKNLQSTKNKRNSVRTTEKRSGRRRWPRRPPRRPMRHPSSSRRSCRRGSGVRPARTPDCNSSSPRCAASSRCKAGRRCCCTWARATAPRRSSIRAASSSIRGTSPSRRRSLSPNRRRPCSLRRRRSVRPRCGCPPSSTVLR